MDVDGGVENMYVIYMLIYMLVYMLVYNRRWGSISNLYMYHNTQEPYGIVLSPFPAIIFSFQK